MLFNPGDKVWLDGRPGVVDYIDYSDSTYNVDFVDEDEGWDWGTENQVTPRQEKAATEPTAPGTGLPEGWRMFYANTSQRRKEQPVTEGFLDYFPAAIRLAAELSRLGNEKHNPGEEMHHARGKSADHRNCTVRHVMDADKIDEETQLAEAVMAFWRTGAYLQELAEKKYGWPVAPRARSPKE